MDTGDSKKTCLVLNINQAIEPGYINKLITETEAKFKELKTSEQKELLVIMNCPGGSPSASEEMANWLKSLKIRNIKTTMYIDSMAASGGYYIASAVKPILSNKNAIVGSIGVIMPHRSFAELAKKIGVKDDFIAAGEFKKPTSPFEDISAKSKEYLTSHLLKPTYENFVSDVAKNRSVSVSTIEAVAQGQIFIANSDMAKVLVDETTNLFAVKADICNRIGEGCKFVEVLASKPGMLSKLGLKVDFDLKSMAGGISLQ